MAMTRSTTLFTVKISPATPSLVKITLALIPGIPAGDQFPPADQEASPAAPLQTVGAAETELASVIRNATRVSMSIWGAFFIQYFQLISPSGDWCCVRKCVILRLSQALHCHYTGQSGNLRH